MKTKTVFQCVLLLVVVSCASSLFARVDASGYFSYLQELYNRQDQQISNFIINEMNYFLRTYPQDSNAARVLAMQDTVYENSGEKYQSFASALKLLYLYPQSPFVANSNANLQKHCLAEKKLLEKKDLIASALTTGVVDVLHSNRYYNYVNLLHELKIDKLFARTQSELQNFMLCYPDDNRLDQILTWSAELYGLSGNKNEAVDTFLKIILLYPSSPLLPQVMYERGLLYSDKLNKYSAAVTSFLMVVEKYPQSQYAAAALFQSAALKREKLVDYDGAIKDYRRFIDLNPTENKVMDALWNIGQIYHKNLKDYNKAIPVYNEIVGKYSTFLIGVKALEQIAEIYEKNQRDFFNTVATLVQISEQHPTYEKSPDYLFQAASLCEKELGDNRRAKEYYELFLKKYPNHKKAKETAKQLEKIQPATIQTTSPLEY